MNILVDKSLCSSIIECKFLDVESVVQRRCTFLRLLIHIAKLPPGILNASFKVPVFQYHWKLSFKRIFHTQHAFFFFFFWMTHNFCSLPGQFILERMKETRLEMIGAGDQGVHMGGMETDNRKRVSLETSSSLPPPSFLK